MLLKEILSRVTVEEYNGDLNIPISGVNIDSRRIAEGHLFIAVKGTQVDGHTFIDKAISQGATAILVCEPIPEEVPEGVTFVRVADTEDAVGKVATMFYGDPTSKLKLVGVTGTNGKTTVCNLLINFFEQNGNNIPIKQSPKPDDDFLFYPQVAESYNRHIVL